MLQRLRVDKLTRMNNEMRATAGTHDNRIASLAGPLLALQFVLM